MSDEVLVWLSVVKHVHFYSVWKQPAVGSYHGVFFNVGHGVGSQRYCI